MIEKMLYYPPKPKLVLNVGITGHRPGEKLNDSQFERIENNISEILKALHNHVNVIKNENSSIFNDENEALILITSMAEGADQIAAVSANKNNIKYSAVLPFPREEFLNDFKSETSQHHYQELIENASSVFELPGERDKEEEAYEAASHYLAAKSDILISVWDGMPSGGKGGTKDTINNALKSGINVIHINSLEDNEINLLSNNDGDISSIPLKKDYNNLKEIVDRSLLPLNLEEKKSLELFFLEREKTLCTRISYPLLLSALCIKRIKFSDIIHKSYLSNLYPKKLSEKIGFTKNTKENMDTFAIATFGFADGLAIRYAQLYRSGYVANFILAAFAVMCALLGGVIFKDVIFNNTLFTCAKTLFVVTELLIIGLIIFNTYWGRKRLWHKRWLNYRYLAESLRLSSIWTILGASNQALSTKRIMQSQDLKLNWVDWYALALSKAIGIPDMRLTQSEINIAQETLLELAVEQQKYHKKNVILMDKIEHRTHFLGNFLFYFTILVCVAFLLSNILFDKTQMKYIASLTTFFTGILPSFGAAIYGIRSIGSFGRLSAQSKRTETNLLKQIETLKMKQWDYQNLVKIANKVDDAMLENLSDWREVYGNKDLTLPS